MAKKEINHLGDLIPDPVNARRHNPRNVGMIEDSLHEVGFSRSLVIDEDGVILAGNATAEAAGNAGIEKVQVVEADGNTIIAVRRTGLTDEQKRRLALFDNQTAALADWDPAVLAGMLAQDSQALKGLFEDWEVKQMLGEGVTDPQGEWQGMPDFKQEEIMGSAFTCLVRFLREEDILAFEQFLGWKLSHKGKLYSTWYPRRDFDQLGHGKAFTDE